MAEHYKNYIDGRWIEAKSRKTFENRNSANKNDLIGLFPLSGPGGVHQAVSAAKKAFPKVNDKNFFLRSSHRESENFRIRHRSVPL
jgi:acyl-CoA reductase-like NAD-dependent aldehyde dehydrogenase